MIASIRPLIIIALMMLGAGGCKDNPVASKPENHRPILFSVIVFPDTIGPKDSVIVICNAMDPDADTLVYDWITDDRLNIKGVPGFYEHELSNTHENSQVFYPSQYIKTPIDTPWVQCFARDGRGYSVAKTVHLIIRQ